MIMLKRNTDLSASRLRELLDYDPATGVLRRRPGCGKGRHVGRIAGWIDRFGYRRVEVDGRSYFAHRLSWLHVHSEWPAGDIDHINGDKDDNRLVNLRDVTHQANTTHQWEARRDNKSGYRGVHQCAQSGRWRAAIYAGDIRRDLGRYDTPEEAHRVYLTAKREMHPAWVPTP